MEDIVTRLVGPIHIKEKATSQATLCGNDCLPRPPRRFLTVTLHRKRKATCRECRRIAGLSGDGSRNPPLFVCFAPLGFNDTVVCGALHRDLIASGKHIRSIKVYLRGELPWRTSIVGSVDRAPKCSKCGKPNIKPSRDDKTRCTAHDAWAYRAAQQLDKEFSATIAP